MPTSIPEQQECHWHSGICSGFGVVKAYLLCRQPAAQGYTEVLAHLTLHSTYTGPPPGQLFTLISGASLIYNYSFHIQIPHRAYITARLIHSVIMLLFCWESIPKCHNFLFFVARKIKNQNCRVHQYLDESICPPGSFNDNCLVKPQTQTHARTRVAARTLITSYA